MTEPIDPLLTCNVCKHCVAYGRLGARPPKRGAVLMPAQAARLIGFYACEHPDVRGEDRDRTGVMRIANPNLPTAPARCPLRGDRR